MGRAARAIIWNDGRANQPDATEVIVGRCKPLRFAAENHKLAEMAGLLDTRDH